MNVMNKNTEVAATPIMLPPHVGLVLEGGGMRGAFTCGVLDAMLDLGLHFTYTVGVSAGACHGLSFKSRQRGRAKIAAIDMLEKRPYIGLKYIRTQRSIFDRDALYDEIPNRLLPFDYKACFNDPMTYEMVVTNCRKGLPLYLTENESPDRLLEIAKASSALPFVSSMVNLDNETLLDGGITDPIPVERAMETGHSFNIVVLTRNKGYRDTERNIKVPRFIYRDYPRLRLALSKMSLVYNRQLDLIDQLEAEGRILVIRPVRPLEVTRLTSDIRKLTRLYEEGLQTATTQLKEYINTKLVRS